MRIEKLSLRNFKGIKAFDIHPDGRNLEIFGDNETGKTTIFDAFLWLFFDKDSLNQKDFDIKPLMESGEPVHGVESIVEALIVHNNNQYLLKKVFYEKWVKQRGSAEKTFSGHTTDYYIDGVPKQKKEFTDLIASLLDENIFKLLTNPLYFNEQLHWTDRRKLLLKVCGDVSVADVLSTEPKLEALRAILDRRSLEDHRKVLTARRREINDQLERIPVRIDEVQRGIPDIKDMDFEAIEGNIRSCRAEQEEHRQTISRIKGDAEVAQKMKELAELDAGIINIKSGYEQKNRDELMKANNVAIELYKQHANVCGDVTDNQYLIENTSRKIENQEKLIRKLRGEWHDINNQAVNMTVQDAICPACGQQLPEAKLVEARDKFIAAFNLNRANQLEIKNNDGRIACTELTVLKDMLTSAEFKMADLKTKQSKLAKEYDTANNKIRDINKQASDYTADAEYKEKILQKENVLSALRELGSNSTEAIRDHEQSIETLETAITHYQGELAKKSLCDNGNKRIAELRAEERQLAKEYEGLDRELNLTDLYIRTQVNLLEGKINSRFDMARFKLFSVQINGAVEECCECTYKGVPYRSMNNAAKINSGLDIINTLSEFYNYTAPVWIDNSEAVTRYVPTEAQFIKLIVSEKDKILRWGVI